MSHIMRLQKKPPNTVHRTHLASSAGLHQHSFLTDFISSSPRGTLKNNLLHIRSFSSDNADMTGNEFIRKVKAYGRKRGIAVTLNASRGKGSHQTLYFGSAFTIVRNPKDELKTGTFHGICSQLGIKPIDL